MILLMRAFIVGLVLVCLTASSPAVQKTDLDQRLRLFAAKFEQLQAKPGLAVPATMLRQASGIVMLNRVKAGLGFGYQGGGGVAMLKDPVTGKWGAPAFLSSNEGSFGLQIGGQASFTVILLMNTNATRMLTESSFRFGGEASGTAGNSTGSQEDITSSVEPLMLTYSDTSGLYGGAVVKGGTLAPDTGADVAYYGQYLTAGEILFDKKVKPTEAATYLADKLEQFSK
jgi:lipid-binding SYLF domain-containing protein